MTNFLKISLVGLGLFTNLLNIGNEEITIENLNESKIEIEMEYDFNEYDVYEWSHASPELFYYLPVRAIEIDLNGITLDYLVTTDGRGFLVNDRGIENGKDYVIEVGIYSNEIYDIEHDILKFTDYSDNIFRVNESEFIQNAKDNIITYF